MSYLCGYSLTRLVDASVFAATPGDVRAWARIANPAARTSQGTALDTYEDDLILERIKSATELIELRADRVLCSQTWRLQLDSFPSWEIQIPKGPWQSITWVKYYDTSGAQQTLSSALYEFDAGRGIVAPIYNGSWPSGQYRMNAVEVKFVSGYGASPASVPAVFKDAICATVLDWLENRRNQFELPNGVQEKLLAMWSGRWI